MTVFLTVLAGVITFVLGQLILKLVIDSVQDFKRVVADVSHALIDEAVVYLNPGVTGQEREQSTSKKLRELSSRLNAQMYLIPKYRFLHTLLGLPSQDSVTNASRLLIGLSNSLSASTAEGLGAKNPEKAQRICDLLGIYVPPHERLTDET